MILGFVILSVVAGIFMIIGASSWRAKEPVGFFTFTKPPKVKDVAAYNHAVAKIWFVFAILLEITGSPLLFSEQNSPIMVLPILTTMLLAIGIMVAYVQVEKKYKV